MSLHTFQSMVSSWNIAQDRDSDRGGEETPAPTEAEYYAMVDELRARNDPAIRI